MSRDMFRRVALSQAAPLAIAASGVPLTALEVGQRRTVTVHGKVKDTLDYQSFDSEGRVVVRQVEIPRGR